METLDTSGLMGPAPVLRTRRKLKEMKVGDKLTVLATDPAAVEDVPAFCSISGHRLLMVREDGETLVFEIERGERNEED